MSSPLSRSLLVNTLWSFVGRFGYLAVGLAANIILVRLLSPTEFGQVAIMMFFVVLASVLIESGLAGALIRKQDVTETDYSTVFIFNLSVSLVLMAALIVSSGFIAEFYNEPKLEGILMASSLLLIVNALRVTQAARLIKELKFKVKAVFEFIAIVTASVVAVVMAYRGAGVWALVALQLSASVMLTVLMWLYIGPLKSWRFSGKSFTEFYKFGVNTTLASLLNSAFDNIYQLVLAKYFSIQHSGYFYQAKKLQEMPTGVLQTTMLGVVYSTLSRLQDNSEEFDALYQNATKGFTILVAFICLLLFYYSSLIVAVLYGGEWSASATYLQFLAIASFFYLQEVFNRVVFKIFDRTEMILKLELFKKAIQMCTIIYGVWLMSITALLYGFVLISVIGFLVNYYCARRVRRGSGQGFLIIVKVCCVSVFVVLICECMAKTWSLTVVETLWMLPIIFSSYFILLHFLRIISFRNDLRRLLVLFRGN